MKWNMCSVPAGRTKLKIDLTHTIKVSLCIYFSILPFSVHLGLYMCERTVFKYCKI